MSEKLISCVCKLERELASSFKTISPAASSNSHHLNGVKFHQITPSSPPHLTTTWTVQAGWSRCRTKHTSKNVHDGEMTPDSESVFPYPIETEAHAALMQLLQSCDLPWRPALVSRAPLVCLSASASMCLWHHRNIKDQCLFTWNQSRCFMNVSVLQVLMWGYLEGEQKSVYSGDGEEAW